jgi:hypothetical protein
MSSKLLICVKFGIEVKQYLILIKIIHIHVFGLNVNILLIASISLNDMF